MDTATIMVVPAAMNKILTSFQANLTQVIQSILATPKQPIKDAEVGIMIFVNPSPSWNASTATCLDTPTKSDRGAINGIVIAAWPEPEATKKLKIAWNKNMISALAVAPNSPMPLLA